VAFETLATEDQALLRDACTLVAFGHEHSDETYPLPVIPFPDWREINNLFVEKEFYDGNRRSTL
jgi:hypothetical protein